VRYFKVKPLSIRRDKHYPVSGKVNVPNIIRSKVWKTRTDTNATWTKWSWEIILAVFQNQQGKYTELGK